VVLVYDAGIVSATASFPELVDHVDLELPFQTVVVLVTHGGPRVSRCQVFRCNALTDRHIDGMFLTCRGTDGTVHHIALSELGGHTDD